MGWTTFLNLLANACPANSDTAPRQITARNRRDAAAFRIWQFCDACEWDCTLADVAEALELSLSSVRGHCASRGWTDHMRAMSTDRHGPGRNSTLYAQHPDGALAVLSEAA